MRKLLLLMGFVLMLGTAWAQRQITGKVSDDKGNPAPNVSVQVKGSKVGTVTGSDGSFTLTVPADAKTLVISSIGFSTQELSVNDRSNFALTLQKEDQSMSEVVVVAYGTAKKGAVTNSVAQVTAKELENRPVTNVISALSGVAPGVTTNSSNGQPGSSPAVRIRGFGSLNASSSPLYVVDGVPYDYDISNINVDDIENVSVLKDAASSALYGARAANGVIQITTKKGKKDRTQISANVSQGFVSRAIEEYERVGAMDYYPLMWEAYRNSLVYPTSGAAIPVADASRLASGLYPRNTAGNQIYGTRTFSDISQLLAYNPFNVARTEIVRPDGTLNPNAKLLYADDLDWLQEIQRTGSRGDYTVSVSGGAPKSDYYLSLGYTNEKGYVENSDYKRYSSRLNMNTQPLGWLKLGLNIAGIVTKANQGADDGSSTGLVNPFYTNRIIGPIYPVYAHDQTTGAYILDEKGNRIYDLGSMANLGLPNRPTIGGRHAIYETLLNENILQRNALNNRLSAEVSFLRNFKFTTNVSADISNSLRSQFENKIVGDGAPSGRARRNTSDNLTLTINQLLNFNKTFGRHTVEALIGHENYDATYKSVTTLRTGQIVDGITELSNFTTTATLASNKDRYKIESYLSRANYSLDNKYFLSASLRRDGSSRFHPDNRWGNFWSVSGAWRIDQEAFMSNLSWLSALKLRASYGQVGNDDILDANGNSIYYAYQSFYNVGQNNNTEPGAAQSTTSANPALKWEKNNSFDVALDFGLLKNRINGSVEYFDRRSDNLLFRVPPPVSSGTLSDPQNAGSMYNKGIEVSVNGDVIRKHDFNWNLGVNWTTFENKITKMPQTEVITGTQKWMVGQSRYDFWLRDWYGVNPADGAALFVANANVPANSFIIKEGGKDVLVTTDQNNAAYHYAGSAIPDFYGSIINSLNYKGFGLSFQLNYQVGGKVYDAAYAQLMHSGSYGVAMHTDITKRWQKAGDITDVPRLDAGRNTTFGVASDRWLVDASYLNVQNVTFHYTLPKGLLSKAHLQNTRVYVSGENLYMFTKRQGLNPTQNFTGQTSNVYVPSRVITAGINLSL
ncbi:SusC/RagA family TonB-linked outer membrane protein [Flavisolibacter tropicus]|uniref:TonB-dependent receptor n=1 Tax=Flavisolibacter tropicus TaxID=1492898 RepID=A0A172TZ21_9BACT|nr:TonB-dependent receptor [Flavisolibacter tropicus]ANE52232.1 hypothetical protein SY85_18805 [Flavisolibacter tropicus]